MDSRMIPQNSPEWDEVRLGRFTASKNGKIIYQPKKNGELGAIPKNVRTHIIDKVKEARLGKSDNDFKNSDMDRGHENEPRAAVLYMTKTGIPLMKTGFWKLGDHAGASPDRITFDHKGGVEIKSADKRVHTQHSIIIEEKNIQGLRADFKDKYWQCITCMEAVGSDWWDFCSYYKGTNKDGKEIEELRILRIERKHVKDDIKLLHACLKKAIDKKKYYLNLLNGE